MICGAMSVEHGATDWRAIACRQADFSLLPSALLDSAFSPFSPSALPLNCSGQAGHIAKFCPESTCHRCGQTGHIARECNAQHQQAQQSPEENDTIYSQSST